MAKHPKRPRDMAQLAKLIGDIATGQVEDDAEPSAESKRAAKGGNARAKSLSRRKRATIARKAARKRWEGR